jgi:hypothetical protein
MSDETQVLRTIDWRSVFPFTQIFRAFRVAIHPSKLVLAFVAIVLIYLAGRALDAVWPVRHLAVSNEPTLYEISGGGARFDAMIDQARLDSQQYFKSIASEVAAERRTSATQPAVAADRMTLSDVRKGLLDRRDRAVKEIEEAYARSPKAAADKASRSDALRNAHAGLARSWQGVQAVRGQSPMLELINFQTQQIHNAVRGVISFNWFNADGVTSSVYRFIFVGPVWAIAQHPLYFGLLGVFALLVLSVFGGAIARVAAVHVAKDEKISIREALRFSLAKLLSFATAPLLPLILIGAFALVLAVLGWLTEIRFVGSIATLVVSAGFIVVIGACVLLACTMIGTLFGAGLMYPSIAVEGSDSFDAISRSFSYVFARPWRLAFYSVVGIVYAALCYLFLRFIVFMALGLAHSTLLAWTADTGPDGTTSLANAWNRPDGFWGQLFPPVDYVALTFSEKLSAIGVSFWVYVLVTFLGAFLISLYISLNTIFYYLLRLDVDVTELDDVYLEPADDDLDDEIDPAEPESATSATSASPAPAPETPPNG